ncbi:MAG TPA: apolipoprotein N-acyltransferase [Mycobacteriales bacterium]|nr:apolipoprotein N-acyltransferase [Mycobacteriales bacterium]
MRLTRPPSLRRDRLARPAGRAALAAACGICLWASFPPLGWWPAAVVGVAGFTLLVRTSHWRGALGLGYAFGVGFWVPLLSFLHDQIGIAAWAAVVIIESLWLAAQGLALHLTARLRWWPLAGALLWVVQEFARDRWPFGGFPWGRLAFGQAGGPLLHLAAVGGAPLVTFAVALAGGLLGYAVLHVRRPVLGIAAVAGIAVVAASPLAVGLPTAGTDSGGPASAVIAAVQGNVPRLGLAEFAQRRAVTSYHLAETQRLAALVQAGRLPRPDLVIWPENASDLDPRLDALSRATIDAAAQAVGVPLLVGAVLNGPGPNHVRNAAIVWSPQTGPGQIYIKRHLVPFGEYLPFRSLVTKLSSKFSLVPRDFVPGHRPGTLTAGPVRLADAICFEVADDAVVRQAVTGGGRILVVQTNNADYEQPGDSGSGGETAQQLAISRLRAVEHGRAVVVAATSGVSAMIAPDGRVLARTDVYTPALLDRRLPLRDPLTIADRLGPAPEWGLSAAGLLALLLAIAQLRWQKPRPQVEGTDDAAEIRPTSSTSPGATQPAAR